MKKPFILLAFTLSGCAQWNELSDGEKVAYTVSGAVLVGALIIRNGQGDTNNVCVSTKSIRTGCEEWIYNR